MGDQMKISYSKQAVKFLKKQTPSVRERIQTAVHRLPKGDIVKLSGEQNLYRLRVGDYIVIIDKQGAILYIKRIDNRGQAYKR